MERNPIMLTSEHNRILDSTQKRCDEKLDEQRNLGFWRGVALTFWLALAGTAIGAVVGYSVGSDANTPVCVPLYDQTGLERCQ